MSTVDLGAGVRRKSGADALSLPPELIQAIQAAVLVGLDLDRRPPVVHVAAPGVTVGAPDVLVTPTFTVEAGEAPVVHVTVPGLEEFAKGLADVHADLQALLILLQRPVTKTVERGSGGLIDSVKETR